MVVLKVEVIFIMIEIKGRFLVVDKKMIVKKYIIKDNMKMIIDFLILLLFILWLKMLILFLFFKKVNKYKLIIVIVVVWILLLIELGL